MSDTFEFAGDHMRITEDAEGTTSITFDDTGTGRRCGERVRLLEPDFTSVT